MKRHVLSPSAIDAFKEDGAVVLRGVFDASWISKLRRGLDQNMAAPGPYRREYGGVAAENSFFGDYCNWRRIPEYEAFVRASPAAELAAKLMSSVKTNFFHEHVVVKAPGADEPTPWHHDFPYYCIDGKDTCSLWVPLDPVSKDSSVEFIAGSHRWGRLFQPKMFVGDDYPDTGDGFEVMPDIEAERGQHRILAFDLQPGDCIAFDFRAVHGAPGNRSSENWRRAIAFRWTGDDVVFALRKGVMSPPFHEFDDCRLRPGEVLDSDLFPVIEPD